MEKEILTELIKIAGNQKELSAKTQTAEPRISEWMKNLHEPKLSKLCKMANDLGFKIELNLIKL